MCHLALILADLLDWGTPCNSSTKFPEQKHSILWVIVTVHHYKGFSSYLWDNWGASLAKEKCVFRQTWWLIFWRLLLLPGANRETIGAVRMWWWWVRQVPGGRKYGEDISHSPSHRCSWVFCEISSVTQESQEKLGGKQRSLKGDASPCAELPLQWGRTKQQEPEPHKNVSQPPTAPVLVRKVRSASSPALGRWTHPCGCLVAIGGDHDCGSSSPCTPSRSTSGHPRWPGGGTSGSPGRCPSPSPGHPWELHIPPRVPTCRETSAETGTYEGATAQRCVTWC